MTVLLSLTAWVMLGSLTVWQFGGTLLRLTGGLLGIGGLVATASTGSPSMALAALIGGMAWLAGHWLWAVRHHYFRSPLARRIFVEAFASRVRSDPRLGRAECSIPERAMRIASLRPRRRTATTTPVRLGLWS
jgi:hypothetical protein